MEGILIENLTVGAGVFLSALVLLMVAIGGALVGYLADEEKAGKRFFWTEAPLPEPELRQFLPREVTDLHPV